MSFRVLSSIPEKIGSVFPAIFANFRQLTGIFGHFEHNQKGEKDIGAQTFGQPARFYRALVFP